MVGFRGLDWIYDVTTRSPAIGARAHAFEQRITSSSMSQSKREPSPPVRLAPPHEHGRDSRREREPANRLSRRTTERRQAPAAAWTGLRQW